MKGEDKRKLFQQSGRMTGITDLSVQVFQRDEQQDGWRVTTR